MLRLRKNAENEIQFKYSYNEEAFNETDLSKKIKRGEPLSTCTISLSKNTLTNDQHQWRRQPT